jgi:hypothetical protein
MALQYSDPIRNAQLDQVEVVTGTTPILTIRTGAPPANCAAANIGTVLATINMPSDWMGAAAAGVKAIAGGPWTDASADAAGTAGHFRIHNSANTVCHMQGTVGTSGTDMVVDNAVFAAGQSFSISTFSLTAGNA